MGPFQEQFNAFSHVESEEAVEDRAPEIARNLGEILKNESFPACGDHAWEENALVEGNEIAIRVKLQSSGGRDANNRCGIVRIPGCKVRTCDQATAAQERDRGAASENQAGVEVGRAVIEPDAWVQPKILTWADTGPPQRCSLGRSRIGDVADAFPEEGAIKSGDAPNIVVRHRNRNVRPVVEKVAAHESRSVIPKIVALFRDTGEAGHLDTVIAAPEDDVDGAGDGVRAVDRSAADRHGIDPVEQDRRHYVQVHLCTSGALVEQRRHVRGDEATAIDQRQGTVRAEAVIVDEVDALTE